MVSSDSSHSKWRFATVVFALAAAGVVCFLGAATLQHKLGETLTSVLSHVGTVMCVGATVAIVDKYLLHSHLLEQLRATVRLNQAVVDCGLVDIARDDDKHYAGYKRLIETWPVLRIVVNYGDTWFGLYPTNFTRRFQDPGSVTEFFIVDPDNEPFVALLGAKQGRDAAGMAGRIREAIRSITEHHRTCGATNKGILRIHAIPYPLFPTTSVYLGTTVDGKEGGVILTPYTVSSHKGDVPVMEFSHGGVRPNVFSFWQEDVDRISRAVRKTLFDSTLPAGPTPPPGAGS